MGRVEGKWDAERERKKRGIKGEKKGKIYSKSCAGKRLPLLQSVSPLALSFSLSLRSIYNSVGNC